MRLIEGGCYSGGAAVLGCVALTSPSPVAALIFVAADSLALARLILRLQFSFPTPSRAINAARTLRWAAIGRCRSGGGRTAQQVERERQCAFNKGNPLSISNMCVWGTHRAPKQARIRKWRLAADAATKIARARARQAHALPAPSSVI